MKRKGTEPRLYRCAEYGYERDRERGPSPAHRISCILASLGVDLDAKEERCDAMRHGSTKQNVLEWARGEKTSAWRRVRLAEVQLTTKHRVGQLSCFEHRMRQ